MTGIDGWLARKYQVQGQEADARTTAANAEAELQHARSLNMPAEGSLLRAQAGLQSAQAAAVPVTTQAQAGYYGAMGEHAGALAGLTREQTIGEAQLNSPDHAAAKQALMQQYDTYHNYSRPAGPASLPQMAPGPLTGAIGPSSAPASQAQGGENLGGVSPQSFVDLRAPSPAPSFTPSYDPAFLDPNKRPRLGFASGTSDVGGPFGKIAAALSDAPAPTTAPAAAPASARVNLSPQPRNRPVEPAAPPQRPANSGLLMLDSSGAPQGYARGTSRVPGDGPANVDSVPTNLAPHEAVLNAGGADVLGRQTIDLLNAIGALKMSAAGAPPPPQPGGMPAPATKTP